MRRRFALLYFCFFISGACALIYEVVWQRMLTLVFGLSTLSVAAVVSAFLAGLALGARLFGGWADRSAHPLRLYAGIELCIAAAGLASGHFIQPLMEVFRWFHGLVEPGWLDSNLIRFALALLAFGVPSVLIGATVPVMARLVAERARSVGVGFGRFYAVNTIGSVAGAAVAGFVLIRMIGVAGALHCAVMGNVAVAAIVLLAGRLGRVHNESAGQAVRAADGVQVSSPSRAQFALVIAAVAGAVGLAYEIAWTRLLAIFTSNSVYVFTMVVTVYLAALALGAGIAARLMQWRRWDPLRVLTGVQVALALLGPIVLACVPLAGRLDIADPHATTTRIFLLEYATAIALVFLPTVLIGMTLPLLVGMFSHSIAEAGRSVGKVYAWNATGTILGAALTGVLLIPLLGMHKTLLGLAGANFLIAASAAVLDRSAPPVWRGLTHCAAGGFVLLVALMPSTTRFYRPVDESTESVIYYAEGPSATVHVSEFSGDAGSHRTLFVDSKSVGGTYDEIVTDQKMLAHLPLLLHPAPKRALTVGFGTGGTSYSILLHRVGVDCVEIEPRVVDAYRFFESENRRMVGPDHDRLEFHLVLDDARAWLHVAPYRYDVIVTDVTSIQYRGNGNLYTTDYFRLMKANLQPGGLGCAWIPISGITPEQLKILVRSFGVAYPHTSIWYMVNLPTDFVILVGTPEPLAIDLDDLATRMSRPLVKRDMGQIGMDNPYKIAACLLLAGDDVASYAGAGALHTDDRPV
ncbi:MAG: fused MFS/spermidine synthase, partial [Planctomycetota bacterium]